MAALFNDNNGILLHWNDYWESNNSGKIHFTQTRHSIPVWGWLASIWALARSRGNCYSKNVLRDFLTWVAILIGLCSSILPAHWISNFGQKFAKLSWNWKMLTSEDRARYWLNCLTVFCLASPVSISSLSAKQAKLKQRSVEIETDCSQPHIPGVTWLKRTQSVTLWRYDAVRW